VSPLNSRRLSRSLFVTIVSLPGALIPKTRRKSRHGYSCQMGQFPTLRASWAVRASSLVHIP
jgi:hypothetical protein